MTGGHDRCRTICITPVRNEAWILQRFLSSAKQWADDIVIADQASDDGSREIAKGVDNVTLIDNSAPAYDEGARQRLLLDAARQLPGPRLIVALDADESLSATWRGSPEWEAARTAPPGTAFALDWVNVLPGARAAWTPPEKIVFAFVDDGSQHGGARIHSTRVPVCDPCGVVELDEPKVLHFQHTQWPRMQSKQRWYQCWETIEHPSKRPIQIYRQYHQMDRFPAEQVGPVDERWLGERAHDLRAARDDDLFWWDEAVLDWIVEYGPRAFARLAIWDVDWAQVARRLGRDVPADRVRDPRGRFAKLVHRWLAMTQRRDITSPATRWTQRLLIVFGW